MAIRRSGRPTANPGPPCPGQPGADPVLVHSRRGLIGIVRDIDSRVGRHFDDSRRFVEVAGLSAADLAGIQERNARTAYPGLDALLTLQEGDHPMELRSMQQLGVVHRNVNRVPRADVEALPPFGVSTIHEGMGRLGLMCPYIRPICPTARLCGTAVRAAAAGRQLDAARGNAPAGTGRRRRGRAHRRARGGFFGELPGTSVRARGGVGLVIDGGCREASAWWR
jgi:hypothetical protein